MSKSEQSAVEIVIIHNDPPCRKCHDTRETVNSAVKEAGVAVRIKEVLSGSPEAAAYGVVVPPMVLVSGKVVSAGFVPLRAGLVKLLQDEANCG